MNLRVLLWGLIAVAIGIGWSQRRELARIELEINQSGKLQTALSAELQQAVQRQRTAEERRTALELEAAAANARLRAVRTEQPNEDGAAGARGPTAISDAALAAALQTRGMPEPMISAAIWPSAEFRVRVGSNPTLLALYRTAFFASVDPLWGPFFRQLDLNPAQMQKFADAQWELEQVKIDTAILTQRAGLNGSTIRQTWNQADLDMKAQVLALLGGDEAKNAQYHAYSVQAGVRPLVGDLAGALAGSESPLVAAQADQLTAILFDASPKTPGGWAIGYSVKWEVALAKAKDVLNPAQLSAFQAMATEQQSLTAMQRILNGER